MAAHLTATDTICDLQNQPLHPNSVILLKALDKLLTVGAYYSSTHDQYLQAAMKSRDAIVSAIGGPGKHMSIEITAQGLMVGKQNIDPHHRNVRLLHDLLVPLNIARFEIDGSLTPEELRQAIAALQEHKVALGQANSFQEIIIENLPQTIRAVSRSVLKQADGTKATANSLDDLLAGWGDEPGADQNPPDQENESERLARKFMEIVTEVLSNLEQLDRESGVQALNAENGTYVTQSDLVALKEALQRLIEVNPDPSELTTLIAQAQQAMDLSQDAQSVDLVFKILKKDMAEKRPEKPRRKPTKAPLKDFTLTIDDLCERRDELAVTGDPVADPQGGSQANQLAIGLQLLRSDPPQALRGHLLEVLESVMTQTGFGADRLLICAQAIETGANEEGTNGVDKMLPIVSGMIRRKNTNLLASFWAHLVEINDDENLATLWPHLVNDLLLGFGKSPRETVLKLAKTAGSIAWKDAVRLGSRLEKQPAVQNTTAALDLFVAPIAEMHTVHAMLMVSPLKTWLGAELFQSLNTQPPSPLISVVTNALGEHQPEMAHLYLELVQFEAGEVLCKASQQQVLTIIEQGLSNLPAAQRQESWVASGLCEFSNLAPKRARPLLERVVNERKFFFFKAWPTEARAAASQLLTTTNKESR